MATRGDWIVAMPLESAWLCVNCECVGNQSYKCPVCEGQQLIPIWKILNRAEKPTEPS
jgi:hypothetical protein